MDLEDHFNFLSTLDKKEEIKPEISCCDIKDNYQNDNDMIICKVCKNVITNICDNPEWRYYGSKDNKSSDPTRCGMPVNTLLPESSVGSSVSFSSNSNGMYQIRKMQQWSGMPYKERSVYKVFLEIQNVCDRNDIPSKIVTEAKSIYKIVSSTKISRGTNRAGIIASCVYFACKECDVPRSSKEIADMFGITSNIMTKGVKKCQEIIHMDKKNKDRISKTKSTKPEDFINRFCNKLNIGESDTEKILKICSITVKNYIISENTPPSIASGCIYYFIKKNKLDISKKNISDVCKISEVTINKCCKTIEEKDELFNEIFKNCETNGNN
jgi:transcription initiation factor TFIIIB Brf1 subunit/transcription initiation factor TFIIB